MRNGTIERPDGALAVEKLANARIISGMPASEYHSKLALSSTGMKELAVSSLHYWARFVDPARVPVEPSPEQKFGTALHCLVLEGEEKFRRCYAQMLDEAEHEDCLFTIEDMREWLRARGHKPLGTRKADVIAQVLAVDDSARIWDMLKADHEEATAGKMLCLKEDWNRLTGCAEALKSEPKFAELLSEGESEVSLFAKDPDTGTPLKARLDWLSADCIVDLKTFAQKRGKSIDQCVNDAIYYEKYYLQAFFYCRVHQLVTGRSKPIRFVFAFVESQPPHEVRLKELRPSKYRVVNEYWQRAEIEARHFCQLWADHMARFGERRWREERRIDELEDGELKGMVYA